MFFKQAGIAGDEQIQERNAKSGVGQAHFALLLGMGGSAENISTSSV